MVAERRMTSRLPSQRELLTNLVQALCETNCHDDADGSTATTAKEIERHSSPATETFDSPQQRNLILTLHVVFPSMLLPALDLLDRNLVRRIKLKTPPPDDGGQKDPFLSRLQQDRSQAELSVESGDCAVYTVRSLATTLRRRGPAAESTAVRGYLVHLGAWSCSCAGFAVDAYTNSRYIDASERNRNGRGYGHDHSPNAWSFGGLGATGFVANGAENPPCCKHLLACLLADRWGTLLFAHVEDKTCTQEELAGIIAGV